MFKNKFQQRQGSRCLVVCFFLFKSNLIITFQRSIRGKKHNWARLPLAKDYNINGHYSPRNPTARNKQAGKNCNPFACKPHGSDPENEILLGDV